MVYHLVPHDILRYMLTSTPVHFLGYLQFIIIMYYTVI